MMAGSAARYLLNLGALTVLAGSAGYVSGLQNRQQSEPSSSAEERAASKQAAIERYEAIRAAQRASKVPTGAALEQDLERRRERLRSSQDS